MATLVPSRLRWRVAETKPVICLTEVSVALMSTSTSSRCLAGSTVKMLMSVRSLLSLDIVGMKRRLGEWDLAAYLATMTVDVCRPFPEGSKTGEGVACPDGKIPDRWRRAPTVDPSHDETG